MQWFLALLAVCPAPLPDDELVACPTPSTDAGVGFVAYAPPGYSSSNTSLHPAVVFFPGAGEEGNGTGSLDGGPLSLMLRHGPARLIATGNTVFADAGALVFAVQTPFQASPTTVNAFLGWVMDNYRVDPRRVVLTGLSSGGGAVWNYARDEGRGRLSAAMPFAGFTGGVMPVALPLRSTSIWAVHSWGDPTVPRGWTFDWMNALAADRGSASPNLLLTYPHDGGTALSSGVDSTALFDATVNGGFTWGTGLRTDDVATLRVTVYPDNTHNSWTRTYQRDEFWSWAFAQRRPKPPGLENAVIVDNLERGRVSRTGSFFRQEGPAGFWGWDFIEAFVALGGTTAVDFQVPTPPSTSGFFDVFVSNVPIGNAVDVEVSVTTSAGMKRTTLDGRTASGFTNVARAALGATTTVRLVPTTSGIFRADAVAVLPVIDVTEPLPPTQLVVAPALTDAGPFTLSWDAGVDDLSNPVRHEVSARGPDGGWSTPTLVGSATAFSTTPPDEGTWEFRVRALDSSRNSSVWATSAPVRLDLSPPTVPAAPMVSLSGNDATVSWLPSTDAVTSVELYEVERDDGSVLGFTVKASTAQTSLVEGSLPAGTWRWRVRARDSVGRWSAFSVPTAVVVGSAGGGTAGGSSAGGSAAGGTAGGEMASGGSAGGGTSGGGTAGGGAVGGGTAGGSVAGGTSGGGTAGGLEGGGQGGGSTGAGRFAVGCSCDGTVGAPAIGLFVMVMLRRRQRRG
ncbi:MAG: hypothetical protein Q8S33_31745 [Myxococcales bacterium]|nr:hypothetical protein [Myxococcales bacterium]